MAESQEKPADNTAKTLVLIGHGGFDKLTVQQKERPKPGQGELLVNVKATGINFAELMARQGMFAPATSLWHWHYLSGRGDFIHCLSTYFSYKDTDYTNRKYFIQHVVA